jgi:hypothetical protein
MIQHPRRFSLARSSSGLVPSSVKSAVFAVIALATATLSNVAIVQAGPASCQSPDPTTWPASAKPYYMIAFDTSGSMGSLIGSNNSCGYPNTRTGHGKCAVKNLITAYSAQVNFGLASYALQMTGCSATCYTTCMFADLPNNSGISGCGPEPNPVAGSPTRAGANILVPMLNDTTVPPPVSNVAQLLSWVDNDCTGSNELFASQNTPLNGILRDMLRYYSASWTYPGGGVTYTSPLTSAALGELACRSVNVILVTDGDDTCDYQDDAVAAAQALFNGFSSNGIGWSVKVYVINFLGASVANTDAIAAAGGTIASHFATNEAQLAIEFAKIIGDSKGMPETCDGIDNNCNGCIDEGCSTSASSSASSGAGGASISSAASGGSGGTSNSSTASGGSGGASNSSAASGGAGGMSNSSAASSGAGGAGNSNPVGGAGGVGSPRPKTLDLSCHSGALDLSASSSTAWLSSLALLAAARARRRQRA